MQNLIKLKNSSEKLIAMQQNSLALANLQFSREKLSNQFVDYLESLNV